MNHGDGQHANRDVGPVEGEGAPVARDAPPTGSSKPIVSSSTPMKHPQQVAKGFSSSPKLAQRLLPIMRVWKARCTDWAIGS